MGTIIILMLLTDEQTEVWKGLKKKKNFSKATWLATSNRLKLSTVDHTTWFSIAVNPYSPAKTDDHSLLLLVEMKCMLLTHGNS